MQDKDLDSAINQALDKNAVSWPREDVENIIREVLESLEGDVTASHIKLFQELESLAKCIADTKSELAAIRPDEIRSKHLPQATDELDAIVGATEEATGSIMDACEHIEEMAGKMDEETSTQLVDNVTKIYEACSFQDITGQRVTKVVKALKVIEQKIDRLLHAFGEELAEIIEHMGDHEESQDDEEAALLNGPQLKGDAIDQDEVDKLFD